MQTAENNQFNDHKHMKLIPGTQDLKQKGQDKWS